MGACVRLLLLAALPTLAGRWWSAEGEVVVRRGAAAEGPAFAPRQRTAAVLATGQAADLECRVLRLGDKTVSWVRSRDLQIMAHAGAVFTADARVTARAEGARHTLRIERLRPADSGRYECQLNTEPKMSLFFNLTVLEESMPRVVVRGARGARGAAGGAATLACEARWEPPPRALPLPPLDVRWRRAHSTDLLSLQSSRGGISLDTERWAARAVSRLTLAGLRAEDAGQYECAVGDVADTVALRVDPEEQHVEAMQRDESAGSGAGWTLAFLCTYSLSVVPLLSARAFILTLR